MITKKYLDFMSSMEKAIRGADNLPDVIAENLQTHWIDLGLVDQDIPAYRHICIGCYNEMLSEIPRFHNRKEDAIPLITLEQYKFFFPQSAKFFLYFGKCSKCESVYWATR